MIQLFKPYVNPELSLLDEIIHSGQLAYGKYAREFEKKLAEYIGIERVLCTNSFNSAYLVIIKALGLKPGDEVIASPMCCLASSQPFAINGIKLIWADVNPNDGLLDPECVTKKICSRTKAILHNHFGGYVGHVEEMREIANKHDLILIDDVSEAFGSLYNNKPAGQWGADATIYSFQTVRLPNAIDGGGISFADRPLYDKAERLRDYGINRLKFRDDIGEISASCDICEPSYGALPNDINGYIGLKCMERINNLLFIQSQNAVKWESSLPKDCIPIAHVDKTNPNYWVYGVLADNKREFIRKMRAKGYYASGIHLPNNLYSLFDRQEELPGVSQFASQFVALPCGWWMKKE